MKSNQQYKIVLPCYKSCPNFNSIICTYNRNNISANSILVLAYKTLSIKKFERVLICQCKKEMFATMSEKCINLSSLGFSSLSFQPMICHFKFISFYHIFHYTFSQLHILQMSATGRPLELLQNVMTAWHIEHLLVFPVLTLLFLEQISVMMYVSNIKTLQEAPMLLIDYRTSILYTPLCSLPSQLKNTIFWGSSWEVTPQWLWLRL